MIGRKRAVPAPVELDAAALADADGPGLEEKLRVVAQPDVGGRGPVHAVDGIAAHPSRTRHRQQVGPVRRKPDFVNEHLADGGPGIRRPGVELDASDAVNARTQRGGHIPGRLGRRKFRRVQNPIGLAGQLLGRKVVLAEHDVHVAGVAGQFIGGELPHVEGRPVSRGPVPDAQGAPVVARPLAEERLLGPAGIQQAHARPLVGPAVLVRHLECDIERARRHVGRQRALCLGAAAVAGVVAVHQIALHVRIVVQIEELGHLLHHRGGVIGLRRPRAAVHRPGIRPEPLAANGCRAQRRAVGVAERIDLLRRGIGQVGRVRHHARRIVVGGAVGIEFVVVGRPRRHHVFERGNISLGDHRGPVDRVAAAVPDPVGRVGRNRRCLVQDHDVVAGPVLRPGQPHHFVAVHRGGLVRRPFRLRRQHADQIAPVGRDPHLVEIGVARSTVRCPGARRQPD